MDFTTIFLEIKLYSAMIVFNLVTTIYTNRKMHKYVEEKLEKQREVFDINIKVLEEMLIEKLQYEESLKNDRKK